MNLNGITINYEDSLSLNLICSVCNKDLAQTKYSDIIWYHQITDPITSIIKRYCSPTCENRREV